MKILLGDFIFDKLPFRNNLSIYLIYLIFHCFKKKNKSQ